MKRLWFRSIIFNLIFYFITALFCFLYIPFLILPRSLFIGAVEFWVNLVAVLERTILGLHYEVRGLEHLPENGQFIVAAKHQSAYETLKLHILFKDPAVILKRELLWLPLWGAYLWKSDVIAIDRSTPESARKSISEGAFRVKHDNRPIIIFPQGTRVFPETTTAEKPYKSGIVNIQNLTKLPIVPLAMNSGVFWPRNGFFKSGGKVVFEFLEPIEPGGEKKDIMRELERKIETTSSQLMNEARIEATEPKKASVIAPVLLFLLAIVLFALYSFAWFEVAGSVKQDYKNITARFSDGTPKPNMLRVSGYPGPVNLYVEEEVFETDEGTLEVKDLRAKAWPIPLLPINISSGEITINSIKWADPVILDSMNATLKTNIDGSLITVSDSLIKSGSFGAVIKGDIDLTQEPVPALDLTISMENHQFLISTLANKKIIDPRSALFLGAGFSALSDEDGRVNVPLVQRGQKLYAGPVPILVIPDPEKLKQPRRQNLIPLPEAPEAFPPDADLQARDNLPAPAQ